MYWKDKTVVVTGAGGFIGGHLVKRLKKEGRFVITPNDYELKGGFLYNKPDEKGNFKVYKY